MPPPTPRTTPTPSPAGAGGTSGGWCATTAARSDLGLGVDLLHGQHAGVDLAHRDGQRLLVDVGLDQRSDVLEQALAQLRVVGVDLAGALRGVDDQAVLRVGRGEQLVDRGVGDALRRGNGPGHGGPSGWRTDVSGGQWWSVVVVVQRCRSGPRAYVTRYPSRLTGGRP